MLMSSAMPLQNLYFLVHTAVKFVLRFFFFKSVLRFVLGKGSKSKANLEQHIRIHTGVRPYSCNVCNAAYVLLIVSSDHMINECSTVSNTGHI